MSMDLFVSVRRKGTDGDVRRYEDAIENWNEVWRLSDRLGLDRLKGWVERHIHEWEHRNPRVLAGSFENNDVMALWFDVPQMEYKRIDDESISSFISMIDLDLAEGEVTLEHFRDCDLKDLEEMKALMSNLTAKYPDTEYVKEIKWV